MLSFASTTSTSLSKFYVVSSYGLLEAWLLNTVSLIGLLDFIVFGFRSTNLLLMMRRKLAIVGKSPLNSFMIEEDLSLDKWISKLSGDLISNAAISSSPEVVVETSTL